MFVDPVDPSIDYYGMLSLKSLGILSRLSVYAAPRTLVFAVSTISTWSSPNKATHSSVLVLVVVIEETNMDLLHCFLVFSTIQPMVVGSAFEGCSVFGSDLYLLLNMPILISRMLLDIDSVETLINDLRSDPRVKACVFPTCTLFDISIDMQFSEFLRAHILRPLIFS